MLCHEVHSFRETSLIHNFPIKASAGRARLAEDCANSLADVAFADRGSASWSSATESDEVA